MRDRDTVIRHPHEANVTRKAGRKHVDVIDPRVSVSMQEEGATVTLFFDPEKAHAGDAPLLEVRLTPLASGEFAPWRLLPKLPLHTRYARASLTWEHEGAAAALRALQAVDERRRGLSDDRLRYVAEVYEGLVAEGEKYPIKALAAMQHVDKSTASRWVAKARERGLLKDRKEDQ
jgi:hypothetical protein